MRLILTLLFVLVLNLRADEIAVGRWEGSVRIPERELKLVVDLARDSAGVWTGSITMPALNLKGASLSNIALHDSDLTFALKNPLGGQPAGAVSFKAHAEGNKLTGEFSQGGHTAPFSLEKIGPAQVELPPHSTSVRKEFEGEWKGEYEMTGYPRHVTLKLVNHPEGATADFVIVGKKVNNLPVDLVTQDGDLITIDSHETGVSYEGRWNKKSGQIEGTLFQGAVETPLVLRLAP